MGSGEIVALIVSGLAGLAALWSAIANGRQGRKNAETNAGVARVQGAASVIDGYDHLCEDLREQIAVMQERVKMNETEISVLRKSLDDSRSANAQLQSRVESLESELIQANRRITDLTTENYRLKLEITRLSRLQAQESGVVGRD